MTYLPCILVFSLMCLCSAESKSQGAVSSLPCPDPEDISPCVCTADQDHIMNLDCSAVVSEDQLAEVFSAHIPFKAFRGLRIEGNQNIKTLRRGALGPVSFQQIFIVNGTLLAVEEGALSGSYDTLKEIEIAHTDLLSFPFNDLHLFTSLTTLRLFSNFLHSFPCFESETLVHLSLGGNMLSAIPREGFAGLPNVQSIYHYENNVREITPGTFSKLAHLTHLELYGNQLSHIPKGAIQLNGPQDGNVYLYNNNISTIEVGGITGLGGGILSLDRNELMYLPEDVFRPIFEDGTTVYLDENPIECACDIAWLITNANASFFDLISPNAACYDGELLTDLDPGIYEDLCLWISCMEKEKESE